MTSHHEAQQHETLMTPHAGDLRLVLMHAFCYTCSQMIRLCKQGVHARFACKMCTQDVHARCARKMCTEDVHARCAALPTATATAHGSAQHQSIPQPTWLKSCSKLLSLFSAANTTGRHTSAGMLVRPAVIACGNKGMGCHSS